MMPTSTPPVAALDAAKPVAELVSWQVERSLDERKGRVIAQLSVFESMAAFRALARF